MYHKAVSPSLNADTPSRAARRRAEIRRWPVGPSLLAALAVSLAMWAGLIAGVVALLRL